jgi:hypothetical protein
MAKFRKKPVVIEAWQVTPDDGQTRQLPPIWLVNALVSGGATALTGGGVAIQTLEGTMRADVGDWIIRGVKGELYPCKPDIFEATYEPA